MKHEVIFSDKGELTGSSKFADLKTSPKDRNADTPNFIQVPFLGLNHNCYISYRAYLEPGFWFYHVVEQGSS